MPGIFRRHQQEAATPTFLMPVPPSEEAKDFRLAACPYCGVELKKVPGAATKCPDCHKTMYVRTDHRVHKRLVVTEEEVDEIDDGNEALAKGDLATYEQRRRETYDRLAKKFGQAAGANDVRWAMLNEDLLMHQVRHDYGLYRNTRYKMMEILQRRGKAEESLRFALEIFYIDSCGPSNMEGQADDPRFGIRAWDPESAFRPGSLTDWIGAQCESIGISVEQAARDYEPDAEHLKGLLKMPQSWSSIWPKCL
jgi:hypothetical protein